MDDMKMQAKKMMLQKLKKLMKDDDYQDYGNDLKEKVKKVTVASPTKEGLAKGMSLAEKILAKYNGDSDMGEESDPSEEESPEEDAGDMHGECPMCHQKLASKE